MNKVLIVLGVVVLAVGVFFLVTMPDEEVIDNGYTAEEAEQTAMDWVENNAPTYLFDGSELEVVGSDMLEEDVYEVTLSFTSSSAGYGDRTDEMVAQVITPHETVVTVERGEVVSAITDTIYNEMTASYIEEEPVDVTPESTTFEVYFVVVDDGQEQVVPVDREVETTTGVARAALEELLAGPTEEEKEEGFSTMIPEDTYLVFINIDEGVATADFSEELDEDVAGSAWVSAIREQIEKTLLQFDTISEVVIQIDGEEEGVLQP